MEFKLSTPIYIDGEEARLLPYDFEAMTAKDKMMVSRRMSELGLIVSTAEELDSTYHLLLFGQAVAVASKNKIDITDILRISAKDAVRAGALARDFFYFSDDSEQQEN